MESSGVETPKYDIASQEEQRAQTIMEATTKKVGDQYETGLLWKYDTIKLPDSNSTHLLNKVQQQLADYTKKGYIQKLTTDEINQVHKKVWYIRIFPTINPNKPDQTRLDRNYSCGNT
uniref:CSON006694 protein n=1 Tax=Culicoides sonorensis TaxID=179676 RepID=A0A336M070_CULSO